MLRDLEEEDEIEESSEEPTPPIDRAALAAELARVEDFIDRARSLPNDAKARSFQEAIKVILDLGRDGRGSGKAVVFTESITTQEYLRRLLLAIGLGDEDITLFRGVNDHERAQQALARWQQEEGARFAPGAKPSREVAVRLALVHEFRTRSKVLICTEAGAKGLNLQFCETVINYDLPWNPQRIEQRIGRCHRYSQQRDVTVVNFIARDNEAHRLTFEILSQKLDLFGRVLDASDHVLHEPRTDAPEILVSALSVEFESDLRSIYSRSRTLDEVTREIAALRDKISERRDAYEKEYERTSQIIESRFDENVRRVFKRLREDLPDSLADLDRDLADLVDGYLTMRGRRVPAFRRGWSGGVRRRARRRIARRDRGWPAVRDGGRERSDRRRVFESRASAGSRCDRAGPNVVRWWLGHAAACLQTLPRSLQHWPERRVLSASCWSIMLASSRFSGSLRRRWSTARRLIHRSPPNSCACRRPTARHSRFLWTRNGSMMRSTRPCSLTSDRSRKASRSTSSRLSVSLSDSSRTKSWCAAASERASLKSCGPRGLDVTRLSVPLPEIGSRRRFSDWPPGTRVSNAGSAHWNPERTRFIENGATNITSFVIGRRR